MLTIDYPEGLETVVSTTRSELESQIRLMAGLKMFELDRQYHMPIVNYAAEEIEAELTQDLTVLQG